MRNVSDQKDAKDAVQNAFLQIIRHFEKTSEISCEELPVWLIPMVKNEALMIHRRKIVPLEKTEEWEDIENTVFDMTKYAELVELFIRLPDTYRAVLKMKYFSGCSDKEISSRLGISETAVSARAGGGSAADDFVGVRQPFGSQSCCEGRIFTVEH